MSLLNMMLSGGGGGSLKTITPSYANSTTLEFSGLGDMPTEYILMLTFSDYSLDVTTPRVAVICNTVSYSGLYTAGMGMGNIKYKDIGIGNVSASFEDGTLTMTLSSGSFASSATYVLYYK